MTGEDIGRGFEENYHDSIALHCIRHFIVSIIDEAQALYEISKNNHSCLFIFSNYKWVSQNSST